MAEPFWSAPAERSGDGALDSTRIHSPPGSTLQAPNSLIITAPFHSNSRRSNGHTARVIAFILTFCLVALSVNPGALPYALAIKSLTQSIGYSRVVWWLRSWMLLSHERA